MKVIKGKATLAVEHFVVLQDGGRLRFPPGTVVEWEQAEGQQSITTTTPQQQRAQPSRRSSESSGRPMG